MSFSKSNLRFLLPVAGAIGETAEVETWRMDGRRVLALAGALGDCEKVMPSPARKVKSPGVTVWRRLNGEGVGGALSDGRLGYPATVGLLAGDFSTASPFGGGVGPLEGVEEALLVASLSFVEVVKSTLLCTGAVAGGTAGSDLLRLELGRGGVARCVPAATFFGSSE